MCHKFSMIHFALYCKIYFKYDYILKLSLFFYLYLLFLHVSLLTIYLT